MLPPALTHAVPYFEAWNAHDAQAVTAALADGGTYTDPTTEVPLAGPALAGHVGVLLAAFPDLTFEVQRASPADVGEDGTMVVQWLMHGTNTGSLRGLPPTGRTVALPGAESVTWIDTSSAEEAEQVREIVRPLVAGLTKAPGFISWLGMVIAGRMYTLTAWESADAVQEIMRNHVHQGAVRQFFSERFLTAGTTGVWVPHHLNPVRVRCASCGSLSEATPEAGATCGCGHPLPQVHW